MAPKVGSRKHKRVDSSEDLSDSIESTESPIEVKEKEPIQQQEVKRKRYQCTKLPDIDSPIKTEETKSHDALQDLLDFPSIPQSLVELDELKDHLNTSDIPADTVLKSIQSIHSKYEMYIHQQYERFCAHIDKFYESQSITSADKLSYIS